MAELRHSSSWKPCTERHMGGVSGILENGLFCLCVSLVAYFKSELMGLLMYAY